jgi:CO/xanthine dehydrogenase Mo-binding subunit
VAVLDAEKTVTEPLRLVGKRIKRADSPERLTGVVRYTGDLFLPGLLHARLVRSPYAAARIVKVDPEATLASPGVVRVLTAGELPVRNLRANVDNRTILLAHERTTYVGQPVAVVLAETEAAAEDGAAAVEVEYEPLPTTLDMLRALEPDAPAVLARTEVSEEELAMHGAAAGASKQAKPTAPNISSQQRYKLGDVEAGFREAAVIVEREYRTAWVHQSYIEPQVCAATVDPLGRLVVYACTQAMFRTRDTIEAGFREAAVIVEREYRTAWVHQSYLEPRVCAATVDPLGRLVVYACTQAMFRTRDTIASVLGKAPADVRVVAMPVGGGFGGKFGLIEPLVAACALACGRAVRLAYTRVDDLSAGCPAPSSLFRVQAGVRADGTFAALKAEVVFDAGAKPGAPAAHAALCLAVFYRWDNLDITATEVVTHKTPPARATSGPTELRGRRPACPRVSTRLSRSTSASWSWQDRTKAWASRWVAGLAAPSRRRRCVGWSRTAHSRSRSARWI